MLLGIHVIIDAEGNVLDERTVIMQDGSTVGEKVVSEGKCHYDMTGIDAR